MNIRDPCEIVCLACIYRGVLPPETHCRTKMRNLAEKRRDSRCPRRRNIRISPRSITRPNFPFLAAPLVTCRYFADNTTARLRGWYCGGEGGGAGCAAKLVWKNYSEPVPGEIELQDASSARVASSRNVSPPLPPPDENGEGRKDRGKSCVAARNRKFDSRNGVAPTYG